MPKLEKAKVVLDADRRKDIILHDARDQALALGLELVEDEGLLEEVAGLVEWPVVLVGAFEEEFLEIPPEVIRATIRANQKCFVLQATRGGVAGSNRFILVANIEATDGGKAIVAGNGASSARASPTRGISGRPTSEPLPDLDRRMRGGGAARLDLKKPLDQRMAKLAATNVVFHEKLGTQGERVERIARLARSPTCCRRPILPARARADELARAAGFASVGAPQPRQGRSRHARWSASSPSCRG